MTRVSLSTCRLCLCGFRLRAIRLTMESRFGDLVTAFHVGDPTYYCANCDGPLASFGCTNPNADGAVVS